MLSSLSPITLDICPEDLADNENEVRPSASHPPLRHVLKTYPFSFGHSVSRPSRRVLMKDHLRPAQSLWYRPVGPLRA